MLENQEQVSQMTFSTERNSALILNQLESGQQITLPEQNKRQLVHLGHSLTRKREKLGCLIRQAQRNLGGDDTLINKLLALQKVLTRARHLDRNSSEIEKQLAQENLNEFLNTKITSSNLS